MSWEWLSVVATAAVGIAGIAATVFVQRSERAHSARLARDQRSQDRRQATYERLLKQAIEVNEFVGFADIIFVRHAKPPDVDVESYDAWLVLDLYASAEFATAYRVWQNKVSIAREILDEVPAKKKWYEAQGDLPARFEAATREMNEALNVVIGIGRQELA